MNPTRLAQPARRILLRQGAAATGALLLAQPLTRAALAATSTVEVTEGPYFVDERLNRSDIRLDPSDGSTQDGLLLLLSVTVSALDSSTGKTTPLNGAFVDIWHCNAEGLYSDESANNTAGRKFLRGYQVSNAQGRVQFRSIYPGWYSGRTPHIHCKVRQFNGSTTTLELTTQFFFDEALTQLVYTDSNLPYVARGLADTPHATDQVFNGNNSCVGGAVAGDSLMLTAARTARYVTARFDILIDTAARCTSAETGMGGGGMPGGTPPTGTPPGVPTGVLLATPGTA